MDIFINPYDFMSKLAKPFGAEVLIGDYPYCAWYGQKDFDNKEWEGYWFANEVKTPGMHLSIYVPNNVENQYIQYFGFFHELGHVQDDFNNKEFDSTWDCEVSAWKNAKVFIDKYIKKFDIKLFEKDVLDCLSTYQKNAPTKNLFRSVQEILEC